MVTGTAANQTTTTGDTTRIVLACGVRTNTIAGTMITVLKHLDTYVNESRIACTYFLKNDDFSLLNCIVSFI
jgi:hypothetical protein